jgi:cyclophilin family peptidyl-prolyl cis-trans isomerase/HEAT repeat protein
MKAVLHGFAPLYVLLASATAHAGLDPIGLAEDLRKPEDPALIQGAKAADPAVRARVAQAWGRIQKPVSIDRLFALLPDADSRVRRAAVFALGQFGWKAEFAAGREADILAKVAPLVIDSSQSVRLAVAEAIGKVGLAKTPDAIAPLLANPEPELRAEALLALYRYHLVYRLREPQTVLPDLDQKIVDAMLALEGDQEPLVRRNLAYYFARVKDARGLQTAIRLAKDPDTWVRYFAVLALAKTADAAGEPAALAAAKDGFYVQRVAAVQALAAMKKAADIPADLLKDPFFHVRAAIADALGAADSPASIQTLGTLSQDLSSTVQAEAVKSTALRLKADALPAIKDAMNSAAWPVRAAAYDALAGLVDSDENAQALAIAGTSDEDPRAAASAISAIASVPGDAAWNALKSALESTAPAIRGPAVEALAGRKDADLAKVAWNAYGIMAGNQWNDSRTTLVSVIASVPGAETTADLQKAVEDPAQSVVDAAVKALQDRGIAVPAPLRAPTVSPFRDQTYARHPFVILETTQGEVWMEMYPEAAPIHVATIVGEAKAGKYDGTSWHRVVSDFVVQGGTFDGSGWDNGDFSVRAEINTVKFIRGAIGMPRGDGFDTGSIGIFINHVPTPHLDGQYTVFGQVVQGMDNVDKLEIGDKILKARVIE